MIQLQTLRTKLPIRAAAGRRYRISTASLVVSVALIAQILSACSSPPQSFSETSVAARYPNLNDLPPPADGVGADQVAQIKAELIQLRDDQERVAVRQPYSVGPLPAPISGIEPAAFSLSARQPQFLTAVDFLSTPELDRAEFDRVPCCRCQ